MNTIDTQNISSIPFAPLSSPASRTARGGLDLVQPSELLDAVNLSDEGVSRADESAPRPRFSMIARIRDQIASDSFETDTRIEGTVDRLMDMLGIAR